MVEQLVAKTKEVPTGSSQEPERDITAPEKRGAVDFDVSLDRQDTNQTYFKTADAVDESPGTNDQSADSRLYVPPLAGGAEIRLAASRDGVVAEIPRLEIKEGGDEEVPKTIDMGDASAANPQMSPAQTNIFKIAEASLGLKPWEASEFRDYLEDGKVGNGAAIAEMLKQVGYDVKGANPKNIMARLLAKGWTIHGVADAKPGDVVVGGKLNTNWRKGGLNSDIAVVGQDGTVYHHDSDSTKLAKGKLSEVFSENEYGQQLWVLRPPTEPPAKLDTSRGDSRPEPGRDGTGINREDLPTGTELNAEIKINGDSAADRTLSANDGKDTSGGKENTYWQDYWREFYRQKYADALKDRNSPGVKPYESKDKGPRHGDSELAPDPTSPVARHLWDGKSKPYYASESELRPDPMNIRRSNKPEGYNEGYEYRDLWSPDQPLKPRSWLIRAREPERTPDQRPAEHRDDSAPSDRTRERTEAPSSDKPLRGVLIALAAGHGGHDSGAVHNGVQEKDFTLAMTRKITRELERLGATVKLTRDSDVYVSPENIKAKFNQIKPDLALAIHGDSAGPNVSGMLTMYSKADSKRLAEVLQSTIVQETGAANRGVKYETHSWKGKPFQSTTGDAPSVFLELANLANKGDASRAKSEDYQNKLAEAVAKGVTRYLGKSTDYTARRPEAESERRADASDRSGHPLEGRVFKGRVASMYSMGAGTPTANGDIYKPYNDLTAAHRTLPFGTKVRVTDESTGKSVIVTINDDGPHVKGRHIDLSMASARAIGLDQARGLARVDLEIVKMGDGKRTFHGRTSYMGPEFRNQSRERRRYSDAMV